MLDMIISTLQDHLKKGSADSTHLNNNMSPQEKPQGWLDDAA
ncbi:MAG: hypothetical protein WCO10_00310 [bacterium]